MAYERVNWQDYPSRVTPLNAENLNVMDEGIANLDAESESLKAFGNEGKLVYVHDGALDTLEPSNLDLHVGSPTVVTEAAQMTDSSKIYIYNGDETGYTAGDWYSYDGEQWVDRGPFNEPEIVTDKELTVSDRPADGKVVGDRLESKADAEDVSQLKNALDNIEDVIGGQSVVNINLEFVQGNIAPNGAGTQASTTRVRTNRIAYTDSYNKTPKQIKVVVGSARKFRCSFFSADSYVSNITAYSDQNWTTGDKSYDVPEGTQYLAISVANVGDTSIEPSDVTDVKAYETYGNPAPTLDELAEMIDSIPNEITEYEGKKLSILGDSISTFAGAGTPSTTDGHRISNGEYTYLGNHCRYPNDSVTTVNEMYWKKLIDKLGLTLGINESWAGSRVSWNGTTETGDLGANLHCASMTRISHLDDNGSPDIILVNAGTNDIGAHVSVGTFDTSSPKDLTEEEIRALPVATFADAYRTMIIRLQYFYPSAKIIVMLPNYTNTYYTSTLEDQYCEVIKEVCDYFGVQWIDTRTCGITLYNLSTYLSDGIHPNPDGMEQIYKSLLKYMLYQFVLL